MLFNDTLAAAAAGESVAAVHLVLFDFVDEPFRAWGGAGIFTAAGHEWRGLGESGQIAALPLGVNDSAGQATFALSGVDTEIVQLARSESEKVVGRDVTVWLQFLSAPHRPLDDPVFIGTWVMGAPGFQFSGPRSRTISVPARSIFDDRKEASHIHYSDRDQQARFPGDLFLQYASEITVGFTLRWPKIPGA